MGLIVRGFGALGLSCLLYYTRPQQQSYYCRCLRPQAQEECSSDGQPLPPCRRDANQTRGYDLNSSPDPTPVWGQATVLLARGVAACCLPAAQSKRVNKEKECVALVRCACVRGAPSADTQAQQQQKETTYSACGSRPVAMYMHTHGAAHGPRPRPRPARPSSTVHCAVVASSPLAGGPPAP